MSTERTSSSEGGATRSVVEVASSYAFGYLLAIGLVVTPIFLAGVWSVLGNTRLMDPLINAGIIRYHDLDIGFVDRGGDLKEYYKSQQPIHWRLVGLCAGIYLAYFLLKAFQFHAIGRFLGMKGSLGQHARAYFYGLGINRFFPYATGDVAMVSALEGQGESRDQSSTTVYMQDTFVCFEIIVFFLIGLVLTGWEISFIQTIFAVLFWGVLYFIARPGGRNRVGVDAENRHRPWLAILREMSNRPMWLAKIALLSLLIFFLDDVTPYVTSQAFTSGPVILNVPFLIIQGGVVAGYIASRVPITPGGIGQYEFGFGTALYMAGVGPDVAITIALLDGLIRHSVALILFTIVRCTYGVETNMGTVLRTFAGQKVQESNTELAGSSA